jgi:mRNA interferase RelE/StbE
MYHTEFMAEAEDDLARLPKALAQRVLNRLRWLAENFDVITPEPLTGLWRGVFKLRVGDYRVLYTFSRAEPQPFQHVPRSC